MPRKLNAPAIFAIFLLLLNSVYASQIAQMNLPFAKGEPGPAFMPMLLCGFLYVAGLRIFMQELRADHGSASDGALSDTIRRLGLVGPLLVVALTALFIIGFAYLGYAVSASLYTFAIALFFNYEELGNWRKATLYAVLTAVAISLFGWLFFVQLFDLYLPVWEF
ncbi:tripartite tricarboxylate transporter TctB family protein [Qingshengfaniella alkalisoli]|uniref:Tripartite tricarboxylate transporter TctB family protein n=1 Tax=Qingshengfaniella alkalisoli TaxID=2599296 RepID=A0A5B8I9B2_9RHOB|nr:tripartite tricarboxylate transporter TctB family protein [Qingshengfaniella alkalisoli]QDY70825.1 tripartite tricarboxylate transporter TctB family protein [Qingshengfaniella alkalisoli]